MSTGKKLAYTMLFSVALFILALFMMGCAPQNICEGHLRALEAQSAERCIFAGKVKK